jgi:3D-(3,5/4)-trihydroxycyclohexane-1,2-dione acylhydrolase (decyclizing)
MGYEIPGAIGAKLADPGREVFVLVGDGTFSVEPHRRSRRPFRSN